MFKFICLFALISAAFAASIGKVDSTTEKREIIPLLKYERENSPDGSFKFSYEGGDQSFREETAHVVDAGTDDEALEVSGSYRYIDLDGNTVEVHYTAGRNGFVPVGTHILSEISKAAKAAADLPKHNEEELKRKGRSNEPAVEQEAQESQVSEQKVESPKADDTQPQETKKVEETKTVDAKNEEVHQIPVVVVEEVAEEAKTNTA